MCDTNIEIKNPYHPHQETEKLNNTQCAALFSDQRKRLLLELKKLTSYFVTQVLMNCCEM